MKKALLVFALVAFLATGTVFAELTGVGEPTVSGSVSTTYGYDLDSEAHGFYNDSSLTLTLPLLDGSMTKGGDDGMYGEITVDGIGWQLNNDGFYDVDADADGDVTTLDASISAKLVMNSLYIDLGAPSFDINNVDVSDSYDYDANFWADDAPTLQGIAVGFMNDMVTVEVKIANRNDGFYDDSDDDATEVDDQHYTGFLNDNSSGGTTDYTANTQGYVLGAMLTATPMEGVSVPVSFSVDLDSDVTYMAVGADPSVSMAPLTFNLPMDYVMIDDQWGFEVAPSVAYDFIAGGSNLAVDFLYGTYEETVGPVNAISELGMVFTETETDGFVPGLAATLDVAYTNLMNYEDTTTPDGYMPLTVDADASYNMDGLKPYINTGYDFSTAAMDFGIGVEMAAAFTGFDNTVFTLDYTNDALVDGEAYTGEASGDTENGRVTFDVTVSF